MLLETTTTTKKMVEVSFPLYAKDDEFDRLYYVNKRKDILLLQVSPVTGAITIEEIPFHSGDYSPTATLLRKAAQLPNIRPAEFWVCFDKALQCLQETVYIDRGNLFK